MPDSNNSSIATTVLKLLRPLVRILLRNGVSFGAFADFAKWVYVDIAGEEFGISGRKQTDSRISIITGLSRKEVHRVKLLPVPDETEPVARYNRAARVIGGWVRDSEFHDARNRPTTLPAEGSSASFATLVKRYSGDVGTIAILDELLRVGAVEYARNGRIRLLARAYIPQTSSGDKLEILGTDAADLISTIDHNLASNLKNTRFQRKVTYDNLPEEVVPEFQKLASRDCQRLLEKYDRWLAERDRDMNHKVKGSGRMRAGIGIYFIESDEDDANEPENN